MIGKIQRLKSKKGFTMVELIVVIAIIAVLSAIIIPLSMNQLGDAQATTANKSAASILSGWSTEVTNRVKDGKPVASCTFKYDFSSQTVVFSTGATLPWTGADTDVKAVMASQFPTQSKGIVAVQIIANGSINGCTAVAFSETGDFASLGVTATTFTYGSGATPVIMTLYDASANTPAKVVTTAADNTGAIVFGYSPQA